MRYDYRQKKDQQVRAIGNTLSIVAETKEDIRVLNLFRKIITEANCATGGSSTTGGNVYLHHYADSLDCQSGKLEGLEFEVRFAKKQR